MTENLWGSCLARLEKELSAQDFNTWIRPLHVFTDARGLHLLAPNRFVLDWVKQHFYQSIIEHIQELGADKEISVQLQVGTRNDVIKAPLRQAGKAQENYRVRNNKPKVQGNPLNPAFTFHNFIQGNNRLACAAAMQTAEHSDFNPLFIYGGVGLGKTHLMQAVGNLALNIKPSSKVVYLHSERFVADMVKALQNKSIDDFKRFYRSADVLLIDDVQFLGSKTQSQEEFYHTFNSLMESRHRVVITCDRAPTQISGMDNRLKSRLGSGLSVQVQAPEMETRVDILLHKAQTMHFSLDEDVAVFVAKHIESNVRELEGALHRLMAGAKLMHEEVTVDFARQALQDMLVKPLTRIMHINEIQQAVADYFKISAEELSSKSRCRRIVKPRQIAISLSRELTEYSLPEIGLAFGGRDRTTVLHSCRKVEGMKEKDMQVRQDYTQLLKQLS